MAHPVTLRAGVAVAAILLDASRTAPAPVPAPPNLLLIVADDLGYGDLAFYGAPDLRTPHIDRLVAAGIRYDRFYATSPVCSPTRASLLTGRYPSSSASPA